MTSITGLIKDSGGNLLSGDLAVTLDAPLVDRDTSPDSIHVPQQKVFPISNGSVNLNLAESETSNLTYHFSFKTFSEDIQFYFQNGDLYTGPTHFHTDGLWYTGTTHTSDSQLLSRYVTQIPVAVMDFHAVVPNVASVEFAALLPTGIATDILDTSIRRLADLLVNNADYVNILRGGPRFLGDYNSTTYYRRDDAIAYGGSSWIYIYPDPTVGQTPNDDSVYWQKIAAKGEPGGTGGNDTPYDAVGWNGATDAPSRNAVRDIIETLVKASQLETYALLNSPTFTGTPSSTNPVNSDRSTRIATTTWVGTNFATLESPSFSGNPSAVTPDLASSSDRLSTTAFVKSVANGYIQQGGGAGQLNNKLYIGWSAEGTAGHRLKLQVDNADQGTFAMSNSPTFTGLPLAPTQPAITNNTTIATTAFISTFFKPAFAVETTTQQNQTTDNTVVTWDTVLTDSNTAFTGGRFTVPAGFSGFYIIGVSVRVANGDASTRSLICYVRKNNIQTLWRVLAQSLASGAAATAGNSYPVYLNSGDYIQVVVSNLGTNTSYTVGGNPDSMKFWGYRIGV